MSRARELLDGQVDTMLGVHVDELHELLQSLDCSLAHDRSKTLVERVERLTQTAFARGWQSAKSEKGDLDGRLLQAWKESTARYKRERDEARAEIERLRKLMGHLTGNEARALRERDEARKDAMR